MKRSPGLVLTGLILLGCLYFGLYGSSWGYPYDFHSDEFFYLNRVLKDPAIPFWTNYGRWPIYMLRGVSWLTSREANVVLARQLSAIITTLGLAATVLATRELAGRYGMILTAALLAGAPLIVQSSHFFITDVLLTAGTAMVILFALRIIRQGRWGDSLALALAWGVATGSKLTGIFLLPTIFLAHFLSPPLHRWRRFAAVILVAACVALLGQPTLIKHGLDAYLRQGALLSNLAVAAGTSRPPYTLQFAGAKAWTYYLSHLLTWGAGPMLMLGGCAGFGWATIWIVRQRGSWRSTARVGQVAVVWLTFLGFYLVSAGQHDKFVRYILPLLPPLAILAGWFLADLLNHLRPKVAWPLLMSIVFCSLLPGILYFRVYTRPNTRLAAAAWITQNVPVGASICHEPDLGFAVPPIGMGGPAYGAAAGRNYQGILLDWGLLYWASDYPRLYHKGILPETPAALRDQKSQASQIRAWLAGCDWVILSDRFADQYLPLPDDFPAISNFYRSTLTGQSPEFRQVAAFRSLPGIGGLTVDDRISELTFRSFDHPTFWIFQRRP